MINNLSASQHVVLELAGGFNGGCGPDKHEFNRILSNGGLQPGAYRVPLRKAMVITEVDWQYHHPEGTTAAGGIVVLRLSIENLADHNNWHIAYESTITLNGQGEGGISESMTSGFVVSSKARICPDTTPRSSGLQHLILRGYLIADD